MLRPEELLIVARRKWPTVLRSEAEGISVFPLQIPFGRPSTTEDFDSVRRKIEPLARTSNGWEMEWEEVNTRKWGLQRWPARIVFRTIEDLAAALQLTEELRCFREALVVARNACPALEPWLRAKAHKLPDLHLDWPRLVDICTRFHENPRPLCFPRQLTVSADTKFIKEHAGILRELLDVVLADRVNASGATFEERFHLLTEPPQIRFRFLDSSLRIRNRWPVMDCAIPLLEFETLVLDAPRVLIVENKVVFLCLPHLPDTLAILGNGKAAALLPTSTWMQNADVVYWGDCDQAGYGILSALRARFIATRSVLMDQATWGRWKALAVPGNADPSARSLHLTPDEFSVLEAVKSGPWMLEQERIPQQEADRILIATFGLR
jgi:hypothetical protein